MLIGVPREIKSGEARVEALPILVALLTQRGHRLLIEHRAGEGIGIPDLEYEQAGGECVSQEQVWEAGLILKVKEPLPSEWPFLNRPSPPILFCFLHLAANHPLAPS